MVGAIASDVPWALNFIHVMAGILWTGIDLFMGFVIGPIMRRCRCRHGAPSSAG